MSTSQPRVPWYRSLSTQLMLATTLLIAAIVGAVLWQWAISARDNVREQAKDEGLAIAQALALALTPIVADENWNQGRIYLDFLIQRDVDFVYLLVTDAKSPRIVLATPQDQEQRFATDLVPLAVSDSAFVEGPPRVTETFLLHDVQCPGRLATRGERLIEVAQDMRFSTGRYGVLRVGISTKRAEQSLAATLQRAVLGVTACLLLVLVGAFVVSRRIAKPIIRLSELMAQVGDGDLDQEAVVHGNHEVADLERSFNGMLAGLRSFQKYVPKDLVRMLLTSKQEAALGGERRRMTIYFSDIVGFTDMSETMSPEQLVEHLRAYLGALNTKILDGGGTVDKFIGDAIMAFWGAPSPNQRHAVDACSAAIRNQAELVRLRALWAKEGKPPMHTRIGLHTGEVVVGNIGSETRLNYTVIGDAVNLASRLEGLNKVYGTTIMISEATYLEAQDFIVARPLDSVAVKGRVQAIPVYELLGLRGEVDASVEDAVKVHTQALAHYRARGWEKARELFERVLVMRPGDRPAELMIERCTQLLEKPPGPDWLPIHKLDTK